MRQFKVYFFLLICVSYSQVSWSQYSIKGKIMDGATSEALSFANVVLRSATDTSFFTGAVSQLDGSFRLKQLKAGTYHLQISVIGYKEKKVSNLKLSEVQKTINLGKVKLKTSTEVLSEIQVTAERSYMETKLGKRLYM